MKFKVETKITVYINISKHFKDAASFTYESWLEFIRDRLEEAGIPVSREGKNLISSGMLYRNDSYCNFGNCIYIWESTPIITSNE